MCIHIDTYIYIYIILSGRTDLHIATARIIPSRLTEVNDIRIFTFLPLRYVALSFTSFGRLIGFRNINKRKKYFSNIKRTFDNRSIYIELIL